MKFSYALILAATGMAFTLSAHAQTEEPKKPAQKAAAKKAPAKKAAPAKAATATANAATDGDDEDREPDVGSSAAMEYNCELGNKLTVYRNDGDNKHIALRWKKQLLRLTRVDTSTGANRFENRKNGWVWIDIPAKAMLLDSKKGQQLANECRNPEQLKLVAPESPKSL